MERNERAARRLLSEIRKHYGKDESEGVTLEEFVEFLGITVDRVEEFYSAEWEEVRKLFWTEDLN